jgi:hypothetical protein
MGGALAPFEPVTPAVRPKLMRSLGPEQMRKVELIPVLEIAYGGQGSEPPQQRPPWKFTEAWNRFSEENFRKAGFEDPMQPLAGGLPFFRATEISPGNVGKLVRDHLQNYLTGEWAREQICPFSGGTCCALTEKTNYFRNVVAI